MLFFKLSRKSRLSRCPFSKCQDRDSRLRHDRDKLRPTSLHICLKLSFDYKMITSRSVMGNRNLAFAKILLQVLLLFSIVTLFNFKYKFYFYINEGSYSGKQQVTPQVPDNPVSKIQTDFYRLMNFDRFSMRNLTEFGLKI